ncbi:MAG: LacI family transcriptional regulator [Spirochaetaceae bacterium]|nr:LacI family transcriptional regulator [Spirochaetaceae bacterium]
MTRGIDASEIARIAGVSRATVSRVINNYAFVKPATRDRVLQVIEQYGYSPNLSAQILAGKPSNTIGLFLNILDYSSSKSRLEDTHINFMTERVIHTAMRRGYYVLVYQVRDIADPGEKKKISDMFIQSRIDAGVFVGFPNQCDLIEDLIRRGCIAGVFDQYLAGRTEPNRIVVRIDHHGVSGLVDYLAGLGFRNIMYIAADMKGHTGVDGFQIFEDALRRNGLPARSEYLVQAEALTKTHGEAAFSAFMKRNIPLPECILCGNDIVALGVVGALRRHGLNVPEDISVVGSDDILVSQYFDPPLTTMRYDFDSMMKTLTAKVIDCVETPFTSHIEEVYTGEIVVRSSCRKTP